MAYRLASPYQPLRTGHQRNVEADEETYAIRQQQSHSRNTISTIVVQSGAPLRLQSLFPLPPLR